MASFSLVFVFSELSRAELKPTFLLVALKYEVMKHIKSYVKI